MYSLLTFLSWRFYCKLFTVNYIICCSKCHLTSGGITCWNWVSIGRWFCLSSWTIKERFVLLSLLCPSSSSAFWTTQQLSAAVFFLHNNAAVTTRTRSGERGFSYCGPATWNTLPTCTTLLTPVHSENDSRVYFMIVLTSDYCWRSWTCRIATPYEFHVDWLIDWTLYNCSQC